MGVPKRLEVPFHDAPYQTEVGAEVGMRQPIPHTGDLPPGDLWPLRSGGFGADIRASSRELVADLRLWALDTLTGPA